MRSAAVSASTSARARSAPMEATAARRASWASCQAVACRRSPAVSVTARARATLAARFPPVSNVRPVVSETVHGERPPSSAEEASAGEARSRVVVALGCGRVPAVIWPARAARTDARPSEISTGSTAWRARARSGSRRCPPAPHRGPRGSAQGPGRRVAARHTRPPGEPGRAARARSADTGCTRPPAERPGTGRDAGRGTCRDDSPDGEHHGDTEITVLSDCSADCRADCGRLRRASSSLSNLRRASGR